MADVVKEALDSGLFRERIDKATGRKFFVNVRTRKSAWKITPEMLKVARQEATKAPGSAAAQPVRTNESEEAARRQQLLNERLEQARRRAEAEATLRGSVTELERRRAVLEEELASLEGPAAMQAEALEGLRLSLADMRAAMQRTEIDVREGRQRRAAELQSIKARVSSLQTLAESESRHREAVRQRYEALVSEGYELRADIQRERNAREALRTSVSAAEGRIREAEELLKAQRKEIQEKEAEVARAESELRALANSRSEIENDIQRLQGEMTHSDIILKSRPDQHSSSPSKTDRYVDVSKPSRSLLALLEEENEKKRQQLRRLEIEIRRREEIINVDDQNKKLKRLIEGFSNERDELLHLKEFLRSQLSFAQQWTLDAKAECLRLQDELEQHQRAISSISSKDAINIA